jgi:hypothetical protein
MPEGSRESFSASGRFPEGIIYPALVHSGMSETLVQNTDLFNAASLNALRIVTNRQKGDFAQESFFKNVSNIVQRRDVNTSPANPAVASTGVPIDEFVSVKLNRRIGPIDQTLDSFRKLGDNPDMEVLSFLLGSQIAKAMQVEMLDTLVRSLVASITAQATLTFDADTGGAGLDTADLVDGLSLFGDAASRVRIWVMHSKPYYELVKSQIAANIDGVSNFNVASGSPVTLNRPVLVTDSSALLDTSVSPQQYVTLGLTEDAAIAEDSESDMMHSEIITGSENLVARLQGEYAYNVGCKGVKWDVTNGGVNPNDAALATGTNWDSVMDSVKDLPGVAIRSQFA